MRTPLTGGCYGIPRLARAIHPGEFEQKQTIAAQSLAPGASSTEVARQYGISSGQLYTWRHALLAAQPAAVTHTAGRFADLVFSFWRGEMWRQQDDRSETVDVYAGVSLTIPLETSFQFRSFGYEPLAAIGVTMPPWPGDGEAVVVAGPWQPTIPRRQMPPGELALVGTN